MNFSKEKVLIAPSLLVANQLILGEELVKIEKACADLLHIDLMDGHFVPNLSFSPDVVKQARCVSNLFFDVHLMISDPEKYMGAFCDAGADLITVHYEAVENPEEIAEKIHSLGVKAGLSVKPGTKAEEIYPYIKFFDLILVMTVEPGFGGQSYIEEMNEKISKISNYIKENKPEVFLQVDGGVKVENASVPYKAGANILVAGSAVFNSESPADTMKKMRKSCE